MKFLLSLFSFFSLEEHVWTQIKNTYISIRLITMIYIRNKLYFEYSFIFYRREEKKKVLNYKI